MIIKKYIKFILLIGVLLMPYRNYFISDPTIILEEKLKDEAIDSCSSIYGVEKALIKAIINQESKGEQFARRNDKEVLEKQKWFTNAMLKNKFTGTEYYYSVGYMQILYIVAKLDLGYTGGFYELFDPVVNINLGTKYISILLKRYNNDIQKAISAYNAGAYTENNRKQYIDPVYNKYKELGGVK